jgi:hypothetical protein
VPADEFENPFPIAPASTRLGLLQRGRGAGFVMALRDGTQAHHDLLHCLLHDPRVDRELEARCRYYAELVVALDLPLAPLLAGLQSTREPQLGHEVLAALWRLEHAQARAVVADERTDEPVLAGIVACLWTTGWASAVQLPQRARALWRRLALQHADCALAAPLPAALPPLVTSSLDELLAAAGAGHAEHHELLLGELCRRDSESTRAHLAAVVRDDLVYERVLLAAQALGQLGDERLLPLAADHFARDDTGAHGAPRLRWPERMRRSCLAEYVQHLPATQALAQAREHHRRGGYFTTVAGCVFQQHATAADRELLEAAVAARRPDEGGLDVICELDALGRLADERSAPLLVEVAANATYSHARRRAVHALAAMPHLPVAQQVLREALWDCEDEAVADACAFVPQLDAEARARVAAMAQQPLVATELAERAVRRLRRS